jgi:hypothetical protein
VFLGLTLVSTFALAESYGTAFTYQGQLQHQGSAAQGEFDFTFTLFDVELDGTQVTAPIQWEDVLVTEGTFTVELDFGTFIQATDEYWLEISVRPGYSTESYTLLSPRQYLYPSPRSVFALRAATASQSDQASNSDMLQGHPASDFALSAHDHEGLNWKLNGNVGTIPGQFLGTVDNQALELRVNNSRALRLEPDATSPNIVGGYGGNSASGANGATIAGGGRDLAINQVSNDFGAVGGGAGNSASGYAATIGGGEDQNAANSFATVAGGAGNTASATGAAVGGGQDNEAAGSHAVIAGGQANTATSGFASIAGGGENIASGPYATIGGGSNSHAEAKFAVIAGGGPEDEGNPLVSNNRVTDDYGVVGGGGGNRAGDGAGATSDAAFATVAGGRWNTASSTYAFIGGGNTNTVTGFAATIAGGENHTAIANYSTVSGGYGNTSSGLNSTISGGKSGAATARSATVSGGESNSASNAFSSIGGGFSNTASGVSASVPGGQENTAGGQYAIASGYRAAANHAGTFVWSDSSTDEFGSTDDDQFLISAAGGVGIGTNAPSEMLTVSGNILVQGKGNPLFRGSVTHMELSAEPYPVEVTDLQVVGSNVFVVGYDANVLTIFDASNAASIAPFWQRVSNLLGPTSLHVAGQRAYITSKLNDSLVIMDISGSSGSIDSVTTTAGPESLFVAGKYAYVVTATSLEIFEISDQADITARDSIATNLDDPSDIYVSGAYAYITSSANNVFAIFNIADPDNIVAHGTTSEQVTLPGSVHVSGKVAFVTMENSNSLVAYDVSDPDNIAYLGETSTDLVSPKEVFISGKYAYVASFGNDRLVVFDVSDPTSMTATGYSSIGLEGPVSVTVAGERVYVGCRTNDALVVFDINHLATPAVQTGSLQASQLDITDYTRVNHLDVRGGLNVGIPGALINGDLSIRGDVTPALDDSHSLGVSGRRWTEVHAVNGVIQTSDARLKENVKPLSYGLTELTQLEPVSFGWVGGIPDDTHMGLVAQQVAEVLPELVHGGDDASRTLGLNYAELVPVLINAVKELQDELTGQTHMIESLQHRLDLLEQRE